jgi:uncharacterized protein YjbI with pentapeptide repeats
MLEVLARTDLAWVRDLGVWMPVQSRIAVVSGFRWRITLMMVLAATAATAGELKVKAVLGPEGTTLDAGPAELSARDVTSAFFQAQADKPVDFSGRNLRFLDLSGLDFKGAALAGADLFGADLTTSDLRGVNLAGVNLNRTTMIRADFTGANLSGASLMRPSVATTLDFDPAESPRFARADMRNIRMTAKLIGADFRGADLTGAMMGPHEPRSDLSSMPASILKSCDFSGAKLTDVDLSRAILTFSRFVGADLRRATLIGADLSKVDLSGADVTGADFTDAILDETLIAGIRGFETIRGRDTIRMLDRVRRE